MGLLSKLRSRDEQDADTSDEEEAPPPYVYGEGQAIHASDSKASLASSASKEDDLNDATEELNPYAVYLDCRKLDKGGTSIVTHDTGKVVYTLVKEKRFTRGIVHMYKGDVPNDADQRAASPALAYATVKMSSILLREDEDQVEPVKYKNKEFIRAGKWYGMYVNSATGSTDR